MKLNYKRTLFVGFAFFLILVFWQTYDTIVPKILTDKFGLGQTASGVIMAIDNVLALFMLPLFGTLSDKCKSRFGRRTPFIVVGTVVACVCFIMMSVADNVQLAKLKDVTPEAENSLSVLYDADLTVKITTDRVDGEFKELKDPIEIKLTEKFDREYFTSIEAEDENGKVTDEYNAYVIPARQAYAAKVTQENPGGLIFFISMLLLTLIAMATFRSPAVALMPDVTIKPLRSKGNAVINLMGAVGGILVLILGIIMGTGNYKNALMGYIPFFSIVAAIMLIALVVFVLTVREPQFAREMEEESRRLGIDTEGDDESDEIKNASGSRKLSRGELISLFMILASVILWYMGYNAVSSKYSVYATNVLQLDYNLTLMISTGAAIVSYLPVGIISSKFGRKKMIMAGVVMLGVAFLVASFMRSGSSLAVMNTMFVLAGIGWATINVNSYPMVVELARGGDVGKYTGFYYTASMAAQTVTPILSGFFMDIKMTSLFVYATVCVFAALITMFFVKHGDIDKTVKE